jgi:hypothetical protein
VSAPPARQAAPPKQIPRRAAEPTKQTEPKKRKGPMSLDCGALDAEPGALNTIYAACAAATRLQQRPEPDAATAADVRCCLHAWMACTDAPCFGAARSARLRGALRAPAAHGRGAALGAGLGIDLRGDTAFGAGACRVLRLALFVALCRHWHRAAAAADPARAPPHEAAAERRPPAVDPADVLTPAAAAAPVARWSEQVLLGALERLRTHHGRLRRTPATAEFLRQLLRRVAAVVAGGAGAAAAAAGRAPLAASAGPPPAGREFGRPAQGPPPVDEAALALCEAVLAGLALRCSAWEALAHGRLCSTDTAAPRRAAGQPPDGCADPAAWQRTRANLFAELKQAGNQAAAQRGMISARQQCAVGMMLGLGWDKGVKRALHALERSGQETEAIEFQAMSYRAIERMDDDPSSTVQAVVYVTCKSLMAYQHGEAAAAWLQANAPCYARSNDAGRPAGCLDCFGADAARTRFALDYIADALAAQLLREARAPPPEAAAAAAAAGAQPEPQALRTCAAEVTRGHKRGRDAAAAPAGAELPASLRQLLLAKPGQPDRI